MRSSKKIFSMSLKETGQQIKTADLDFLVLPSMATESLAIDCTVPSARPLKRNTKEHLGLIGELKVFLCVVSHR